MKKLFLLIISISLISQTCVPCTIVMVARDGKALAGSNEDFSYPVSMIWFVPGSRDTYGRVYLGFKMLSDSVQGGMNEKGLFLDANSVARRSWKPDKSKKPYYGQLFEEILTTCATVEDVKKLFNTYDITALAAARIPVMDKSGASMIVEWYDGKVIFIETEEQYQVATNFIESQYPGKKPCRRYNTAMKILRDNSASSVEFIRDILASTYQQRPHSVTNYSFICDLKHGDIYLYNYHDYSVVKKFNLADELKKGRKQYYMSQIFGMENSDYQQFIKNAPAVTLEYGFFNSAKMMPWLWYSVLKTVYPEAFNRELTSDTLSVVAGKLFERGAKKDAIKFLQRNAEDFPVEPRTHYELAEAYRKTGSKEKAINEYKAALKVNKNFKPALNALEKIK